MTLSRQTVARAQWLFAWSCWIVFGFAAVTLAAMVVYGCIEFWGEVFS